MPKCDFCGSYLEYRRHYSSTNCGVFQHLRWKKSGDSSTWWSKEFQFCTMGCMAQFTASTGYEECDEKGSTPEDERIKRENARIKQNNARIDIEHASKPKLVNKSFRDGKYEGFMVLGLPDGPGKYTWPSGDVYEGGWSDGKRHGMGTYTYSNGDIYEGEWWKGKKYSKGKLIKPDGRVIEQQWKNGEQIKTGTILPTSEKNQ